MAKKYLVLNNLRGGRNGGDAPLALSDNACVEALNVDWYEGMLGRKRNGSSSYGTLTLTYGTIAGYLSSLCRGASYYGDELFFVTSDTTPLVAHKGVIYPAGWETIRFGDAPTANPESVSSVVFNNRTYFCYNSGVDRLHYWSSMTGHDTATFYRVGLPAPTAAPTAANTGSGSYAATLRYYKVAWYRTLNGIPVRSELSSAVSFTPSGSGSAARVTQPTVPSATEYITHWEIYGSADGTNYVYLSRVAIATTIYDDSTAPASYSGEASPVVGVNTVPGSWKYIATDGNRLLGAGSYVSATTQSRVWFTPVYGASDIGDAERIPLYNYIDVDAFDGDEITGLVGSFLGNVIVFKTRQLWRLVPTGDADEPYRAVCLTKAIGCIAPKSLCQGEDEDGNPALYFMSHRGPYRLGTSGLAYCGRDVEDVTALMNQRATVISHAVWHPGKHQVWFWVALGSDNYPSVILALDTHLCASTTGGVRGGWSKFTGAMATARCSINWNKTALGYGHKVDTTPYAGSSATVALLLKCDDSTVTSDNGTAFQSYIKTKPYPLGGLGFNAIVGQSHLTAKAGDNVTIRQTIDRDYGLETRISECSLSPISIETRVQRQFEASEMAGAGVVQFQLGDEAAISNAWTLDALVVPYRMQEER